MALNPTGCQPQPLSENWFVFLAHVPTLLFPPRLPHPNRAPPGSDGQGAMSPVHIYCMKDAVDEHMYVIDMPALRIPVKSGRFLDSIFHA